MSNLSGSVNWTIKDKVHTVKNICISTTTDILWGVFCILTEPVPYKFISINQRNNEAWDHTAMWAQASLFRRYTDIFTVQWVFPLSSFQCSDTDAVG